MDKGKIIIFIVALLVLVFGILNYISSVMLSTYINMDLVAKQFPPGIDMLVYYSSLFMLIGWFFLFIYVPLHAKKNGHSMPLWGAITFFLAPISSIIYVVAIKPKMKSQENVYKTAE